MFYVLLILAFIACVLLIGVILIQSPKGNAMGSGFAGQASSIIGVQKTGDVLEKITWGTIATIILLCVLTTFMMPSGDSNGKEAVSKGAEGMSQVNNTVNTATTNQTQTGSKPSTQQTQPKAEEQKLPKTEEQPAKEAK